MAVYTHLTLTDIAEFLREAYGIDTLTQADAIAQGVSNSNYMLHFRDAKGQASQAILTLFEARTQLQDVPYFMALMQHLAQRGLASPLPWCRQDGELWGMLAGKPATIVSFLEGKSREALANTTQARAVGLALANLHRAGEDFNQQRANGLSLNAWQALHEKVMGRLDEIDGNLEKLVGDELANLERMWSESFALPKGTIHADLFPDNVFFEGDAVTGIIDFYFACHDALAYDLAITLNAWCFTAPNWKWEPAMVDAMIAGYESVRLLSPQEKSALPLLLRGAATRILLTRAHDWLFRNESALVTPHDPREYAAKLRFHQTRAEH